MSGTSPFENRLRKDLRHYSRWAAKQGLTAYRIYDRDLPEYPVAVDWYAGRAHVSEYPSRRTVRHGETEALRAETIRVIREVLEVPPGWVFVKTHTPQIWGQTQYPPRAARSERFEVAEGGLRFWVNLGDYLDTGLFLDHRLTRARVREEARGRRMLNLFGYTGAFSVYAAAGGAATTTTVDLSGTYLAWAQDNLVLNGLEGPAHRQVRADALAWLEEATGRPERFDLVVLDPPSYSTSKAMRRSFDIQRDHGRLLGQVLRLLSPSGILYFSTNFRGFQLDPKALGGATFEELTPGSLPPDFQRKDAHRCWRICRG